MDRFLLFISLLLSQYSFAQIENYSLKIEPIEIPGVLGLQSFAFAQHSGKWLIVGGRLDGLHRRQPWATFDSAGNNISISVIDPILQQVWSAPLTSLPINIREQLSSTNPNFFQDGNTLYYMGGYGYSSTAGDHITYNKLTAIDVQETINAIISGTAFENYFTQITDEDFAVSGGHLEKIYSTFYLVGGHRFEGRYNPMNNPTFTQVYTNQIRKFNLQKSGNTILVEKLPYLTDAENLHRRDYNVSEQILPNGQEGLIAFSGVFRADIDLPYLNCVSIDSTGYTVNPNFSQYYNHYHCANLGIYDSLRNQMHTFFFGGIAQYYDSIGILTQNNNVPFVKTIARVTVDSTGNMAEYKLPVEMPDYLGAGAEFISNPNLPIYENNVIKLNNCLQDTIQLGYIFGGIVSSGANIFWTNDGTQSSASSDLYKVSLIKDFPSSIPVLNTQCQSSLKMQVYPNPSKGRISVYFSLKQKENVQVTIHEVNGKIIADVVERNLAAGEQTLRYTIDNKTVEAVYLVTLKTSTETITQRIILEP